MTLSNVVEIKHIMLTLNIYFLKTTCWNCFEKVMINVVDKIFPLVPFIANCKIESIKSPPVIKAQLNLHKCLLKGLKLTKDPVNKTRIGQLNFEIKQHFYETKRKSIRCGLTPGNTKTFWDLVKIVKDKNH